MARETIGEMRLEQAEYQREQRELRNSISEVCYGCVSGGDDTRRVPTDVDHHASGDHACAYHWPDAAGPFPGDAT